ncbi:MAG: ATP-grasp domain-containing protein [Burkholderiales bacterium]|nr:ATP-grasp domain-containing protein [Burkholderiales bacterium]
MKAARHYQVLIVCHAFWEGLARLPHLLHQAGCEINVFGPAKNYVARSRFIHRHFLSPSDLDEAVTALRDFLMRSDITYDWVVIGDDPLLYALEKRRDEDWVRAIFPSNIPGGAGVDFITSKASFIHQCQQHAIDVPDFEICTDKAALQTTARRLGFPLVLKEAQGFAGLAVCMVQDEKQLAQITVDQPLIAQAFIHGRVGSAAAIYRQGKLLAWFSYYRARTWGALGPSAAVAFRLFPAVGPILEKLGELSGFTGLCGIDFIEEQGSGKIVLLEQNFRPTLTMALGRHVGVDFVDVLPCMLQQADLRAQTPVSPPRWQQDAAKCKVIPLFPQDVFRAIEAGDKLGILKWCINIRWWKEMNWQEPRLLKFNLRQIARKFLR